MRATRSCLGALCVFAILALWLCGSVLLFQPAPKTFEQATYIPATPPAPSPLDLERIKIGYVVLVHNRDSIIASQPLLKAIWSPQHFYVYVPDRDVDQESLAVLVDFVNGGTYAGRNRKPDNVKVLEANVDANWGDMGLVQNAMDGLQELLNLGEWDVAINLSGDTFPLMSQDRIAEKLTQWKGKNFLTDAGTAPFVAEWKAGRVADVPWPKGITKGDLFGSQWFVLTREFVEYSLYSPLSRNLLVAMVAGRAEIPDESFFQILVVNGPFNHTVIPESKAASKPICRFSKWDDCNNEKEGEEGDLPCYLGMKDFPDMMRSSCIFARKLEPSVSDELYEAVLNTF